MPNSTDRQFRHRDNDPLIAFLQDLSGSHVHFFPNPGNAGDGFINYATYELFREFGVTWEAHRIGDSVRRAIVIMGGGGNLVEGLYSEMADAIRRLSPHNELVVLPHTVVGYKDLIDLSREGVRFFFRERVSYESALVQRGDPERLYLSHDLTFLFDRTEMIDEFPSKGRGKKVIARSDSESRFSNASRNRDSDISLSWNGDLWQSPKLCQHVSFSVAAYLEPTAFVDTDRLHVGILSAMLGKKVRLRANSYYKNEAVFQHSLAPFFRRVAFSPT